MRRLTLMLIVIALGTQLVGCASAEMRYVAEGGTYTAITVEDLATAIPDPTYADTRPEDVEELRTLEMTALRAEGGDASTLANILTSEFPADAESVPYYAEEAVVDGKDVWVVLEVWGSSGGLLDKQRLWVLTRDEGDVVLSSVFN
jgi:hypothetical protein